ncbi:MULTISPECIES: 2-amino-4-hydroxy-6-hydroxymethyldihydropteridine diphosphokinase [unclassified Synechocystis]|uniref:2-amino-4-hydroxy-6- hydroxymethyldihydropteridine diphosphokinase n=1 Tax=unclassified Synechocystis TaxID=2640012 RepID=UPI000491C009|nr:MULTISPECIES: 2-amino-4-hydroxy-6-hydroxymethyldihydropteridine diphosphokinase [unclassified Synechocystis]AIE73732.1 2-amino-4-hydroxy-6- hydroxymethyldihydropteridine pyrophosphokinase [Synechocystis sp. PCC 6714]MCT0252437.1 2-amino-4-hydroxy-6-hydroxymethyldihydropteridine diphosphokinase [Synechocystis sp. CS-94]
MAPISPTDFQQGCHRAVVGLGGNVGPVVENLQGAIAELSLVQGIEVERCSSWYRSHAFGPPQPDYINGCVTLRVCLSPQQLLQVLLTIEQKFGRIRLEKWGPRTLDLDLIFYGDRQLKQANLEIPHPQMRFRPFVLVPLREIAPDWIDPRSGKTITQLAELVDCTTVWPISSDLQSKGEIKAEQILSPGVLTV